MALEQSEKINPHPIPALTQNWCSPSQIGVTVPAWSPYKQDPGGKLLWGSDAGGELPSQGDNNYCPTK